MSRLNVIRSDKTTQPFMRGILTNELMRRGMSFRKAFKIAEDVKSHFSEKNEVASKNLEDIIDLLIEKRYGQQELSSLLPKDQKPGEIRVIQNKAAMIFSKVLLAQSLTAAGLEPEKASKMSFDFERKLLLDRNFEISKTEIFERMSSILEKKFDSHTADLYRLVSRMDKLDRPVIIYICGAPGTGKSFLANSLSHRLGINKVIGTDSIREIMRLVFSDELLPTLFRSSTEAWQGLPSEYQSREQLITGFCLQSDQVSLGVRAVVERTVEEGLNMIVEGVHLLPFIHQVISGNTVNAYHIPISISVLDQNQHQNRFSERGTQNDRKMSDFYLSRFEEIRSIQDYTLAQCEADDIEILDNEDFDKTLNTMVLFIVESLEQQVSSGLGN